MTTHGSYGHDEQHDVSDLVRSMALSSARLWEEVFERLRRLEVAQGELRDMLSRLEDALPPGSAPVAAVGPASPALGLGSWEGGTGQDAGPARDAETDLFSGPATSMDAVDLLVGGVDGVSSRASAPFADDGAPGRQAPGEDTPVRFPFPPADDVTADLLSGGTDAYGSPIPVQTGWAPEPPPPPGTWVPVPASVNGDSAGLQDADAVFAATDGGTGAEAQARHEEPSTSSWDVPPHSPTKESEETATPVHFGRHAAGAPSASQAGDDLRTIEPMPFELPRRISGAIADDAADVLAIGEGTVPPPPPGFTIIGADQPAPPLAFEADDPESGVAPPPPPPGFGIHSLESGLTAPPPPPPGFGFAAEPEPADQPPPPPPGFGFSPDHDAGAPPPPPTGFGFSPDHDAGAPPPPPPPPGFGFAAEPEPADAPPGFRIQAAAVPPNGPAGFSPGDFGADGPFGSGRRDREQAHEPGSDEDETPPPITPDFFARAGRRRR